MEQQHPRNLPALQEATFLTSLRVRVLAIDANIMISDLRRTVKGEGQAEHKPVAILEMLAAPRLRFVMSSADLQLGEDGLSRLERNVSTKEKDALLAAEMLRVWRTQFLPFMHVLDPRGFAPTEASLKVLDRDRDDEPLARLAHIVGADALLTYDQHFNDAFPVLPERLHGMILSSFRDELRVEEFHGNLAVFPTLGGAAIYQSLEALARALNVRPTIVFGAALAIFGASMFNPRWRGGVQTVLKAVTEFLVATTPELKVREEIRMAQHKVTLEPLPASDPLVQVARYLAHITGSKTSTALVKELFLHMTPGRLAAALGDRTGVFEQVRPGRWTLRRSIEPANP